VDDAIVLITLRYPDEIRPTDELKIPGEHSKAALLTAKELQMAKALVEGMSEKWKPQQYHDTYREDVMAMIKKKVAAKQTKTITMPEPEAEKPAKAKVIDLVSLLQASLGKKPAPAHAGDDDDDDDPPPRKSRKPSADDDEDESDAPPRARKSTSAHGTVHARATAAKKPAAKKTAARAPAKKAVAKTATPTKAPAKRRKAA
jgi:DNA end-binding protein Ku